MQAYVLILLAACVLALMLACAILSHDPGQRANRLVAAVLFCSAWWSLCEVLWTIQESPEVVVYLVRLSSLGWMSLGPLAVDFLAELVGDSRSRLRRWRPYGYALSGVGMALYLGTPWGVAEALPTAWGWSYRFGPLFPLLYVLTAGQAAVALAYWPRFFSGARAGGRREARWLLVGLAIPMTAATLTDAVLPYFGVHVPRLGSTSLLAMGCAAGWSIRRHGQLLIAPGAFTREILDALRDGVAMVRPDGSIRSCNEGLARLLDRPVETLTGTSLSELLPDLPPLGERRLDALELDLQCSGGETIPVSLSSAPLRDDVGGPVGRVLAIRDLREVTLLRNRLVTSGRLAAVGEFAAGIAHEIATPISSVQSNFLELRKHWKTLADAAATTGLESELAPLLAEVEELIEESVEGVERMTAIVRDVGTFSHAGPGRSELVNVNDLIDNALSIAVLSFSVVVERCYGDVPFVSGDPQQLRQIFLNLLLNSIQAVGDFGRIRLVTQAQRGWVVVRVEDDGPGIPDHAINRVFDPFFSTRPTGEGLGMGLAHSYRIARNHGGEISVASRPGLGTTFEVRLPAAEPDGD
jgi:signal transduction histidine kinase